MTATPRQIGGGGLLERAVGYALGSVQAVTPELLSHPTPCRDWDLRTLLHHVNDSLATLHEGIATGQVGPDPVADGDGVTADLVAAFRGRTGRLLRAWTSTRDHDRVIVIADLPLSASIVASTGAIEIAVHGWDISQACGIRRRIPPALAIDLLSICPQVVPDGDRYPLFAPQVIASPSADPSDRLIAFLGRTPDGGTAGGTGNGRSR
jgi:uncharacterized protein (TIGR03086 family)